ncbi:hypothetical protein [Flavivirga sp. 57AJ16]|uniref:hypothetical protein n=1 Tax=Flavivirga sp. 57AJ16 TaxID=3025307 RepID=UPI0023661CBE|nr:hypothetical protein [Flavivirga sp. 57AJ16]MDD7886880.1 hypothetical protein [Flavivirga sp. 57AJ16]
MRRLNAKYFWIKTIVSIMSISSYNEINAQSKTQENIPKIYIANRAQKNIKIKCIACVDVTLNNPNDLDEKWLIKTAIPFAPFKTSYSQKTALEDGFWPMNLPKDHWEFQLGKEKHQRKANTGKKPFHENNWT